MTNYIEYRFEINPVDAFREILMAELSYCGFEGFVETETGFLAYANQEPDFEDVFKKYDVKVKLSKKNLKEENWNASWEKHIKELIIDDYIYIRTSFHPEREYPVSITIDPKMSFGTGHHETTYLMIKQMMRLNLKHKNILDMGAGTGVLAILAERFGATEIIAIDNDKWSYENMIENFEKNNCSRVRAFFGNAETLSDFKQFDVILANINRNILLDDMKHYIEHLKPKGILVMSGFYSKDIPLIKTSAENLGMKFEDHLEKNNWISVKFTKA